jgi:NADPH-dependent 2,4-dienoyl-CoA reductase/sulfur reductase-like enzyme
MEKVVIVGSNHAGIAAANTLLDNYADKQVVLVDRNTNLSYLGCGTALWVGRQIDSYRDLFYTSKEQLEQKGAQVHLQTEVQAIDFTNKIIKCLSLKDNTSFELDYDKLILATGSRPITPKIDNSDLAGIHFLKLFQEGQAVDAALDLEHVKRVAVIGAGYIGVEIAEAIKRRQKEVLLFDAAPHSLSSYYDPEFANLMDQNLTQHGIECHFDEIVTAYHGQDHISQISTTKGQYQVDLVINAIGFLPNAPFGKDHLKLFSNGAYLVDEHQQTSDPNVYAIGDCATIYSNALQQTSYIALASNAVRSGIVAAHNIGQFDSVSAPGVQGSNAISIFDLKLVSTGLSLAAAQKFGIEAQVSDFEDLQKPVFIKDNYQVKIRIVFAKDSRRILGAQLASNEDVSGVIHMFSLAIQQQLTIDQLKLLDIFFLPHFNQPYNYITQAALHAK